jgi:hypothetical protein
MNAIEQWKSKGTPYTDGVLLYATLPGHNKVLLKNFQKKQSPQLHEKLKYELSKIDKADKGIVKPIKDALVGRLDNKPNNFTQVIELHQEQLVTKQALYFHELPEELRPVLLEANTLFKEMCFLKVQLNELPAEAETTALELQIKIADKQTQNELCWKKLDYWKDHKIIAKQPTGKYENFTPANLVKHEQYLFSSMSKMKKRLAENKTLLTTANGINELNKIQRTIAKQESKLIAKNEELLQIKALINGN